MLGHMIVEKLFGTLEFLLFLPNVAEVVKRTAFVGVVCNGFKIVLHSLVEVLLLVILVTDVAVNGIAIVPPSIYMTDNGFINRLLFLFRFSFPGMQI